MQKFLRSALPAVTAAGMLAGCHGASPQASVPIPESQQVIGRSIKELYMAVSAAPPRSPEQQKLILAMAREAGNGKELLLVMRAAVGVFPPGQPSELEAQVHALVLPKMMQVATLDQLVEFASAHPVDAEYARRFVERMFDLGTGASDARTWYRIKTAAYHLGVRDLEQQAQARGDRLTPR